MTRSAAGPLLVRTDEGRVARLTLADPARRTALSQAMISAITTELGRRAEDPAILAIVIAAEGPVFCAGHDLREIEAGRTMVENMLAADAIEGIGAFLEKRNPEWKD